MSAISSVKNSTRIRKSFRGVPSGVGASGTYTGPGEFEYFRRGQINSSVWMGQVPYAVERVQSSGPAPKASFHQAMPRAPLRRNGRLDGFRPDYRKPGEGYWA